MPNIESAKKNLRQSKKRQALNSRIKKTMKESVKKTRLLKMEGKNEEAKNLLSLAYQAIDKAAKRGVIKKNTASRKKSRLAKFIKV
ncbi:MAG: 30S ribosomal protein S20 [Candidatus Niyogibacteria bacterium]|nr:30S ribosomal protein S20 [Candidatus Niyogibacteria bacterium]